MSFTKEIVNGVRETIERNPATTPDTLASSLGLSSSVSKEVVRQLLAKGELTGIAATRWQAWLTGKVSMRKAKRQTKRQEKKKEYDYTTVPADWPRTKNLDVPNHVRPRHIGAKHPIMGQKKREYSAYIVSCYIEAAGSLKKAAELGGFPYETAKRVHYYWPCIPKDKHKLLTQSNRAKNGKTSRTQTAVRGPAKIELKSETVEALPSTHSLLEAALKELRDLREDFGELREEWVAHKELHSAGSHEHIVEQATTIATAQVEPKTGLLARIFGS